MPGMPGGGAEHVPGDDDGHAVPGVGNADDLSDGDDARVLSGQKMPQDEKHDESDHLMAAMRTTKPGCISLRSKQE